MWENRVLFLDGEALVIDKPAGLAVNTGKRPGESLDDYLHDLRFGFQRLPTQVHRLDRDTSGCLLLARNPKAHRKFQRAFEEQQVRKSYLAIVAGIPIEPEGVVDLALAKISRPETGWRIVPDPAGKAAVTHWKTLQVHDGRAMLLLTPETGRTHQLRVHLASGIGIPICGDPVYGDGKGPMLLHAATLYVPRDNKPAVEARAPLPPVFSSLGFADDEQ